MKVLVKITSEVIKASQSCQGLIHSCLIARACRDIFPQAVVYAKIPHKYLIHLNDRSARTIDLPLEAINLIKAFDSGKKMHPISFEIDVPNEIIERIGIDEVHKILSESKTLECVEA